MGGAARPSAGPSAATIEAHASELSTPALVIDRTVVEANVRRMAALTGAAGVSLRPHFKTSKLAEVAALQLEAGAVGLTCATVAEAAALRDVGVESLLWAYEPIGEERCRLVAKWNRHGELLVLLDSADGARALSDAADAAGVVVPCLIDVDTGLGRTGVPPASVRALASDVVTLPALALRGVMTHEGHVSRLKGGSDELATAAITAAAELVDSGAALREVVPGADIVSVGSTPAAPYSVTVAGVSEARPGTYVFNDVNSVRLGAASLDDCAVTILARVVSRPCRGRAIIDAGTKAMSSDAVAANGGYGHVLGVDVVFDGAYEEHGILDGAGADVLAVGDLVRVIPNHVCSSVNLFSSVLALDVTEIQQWRTIGRR